ncbi:PBP1A family penicillin-binding protein [Brevibacillus sp. B_LB10_24]|uniref:transglycosylase domain-containing protein n=1 Tax=Brevibacillus sp. B_LB10_24 TaxID=3380645 RepID=UPI0038B8A0DF
MAKAKKKVVKKNRWLMFAASFIVFLILSVFGGYFSLLFAGEKMIDMQKLEDLKLDPTVLLDKDGQPIIELNKEGTRDYVKFNEIPEKLVDAFIAVEDKRFFDHNGIDFVRVAGAIIKDIKSGGAVEGGSTITQQLAKNVFLSHEKTFWRKTKEASIAINLERRFSKDEIMEMYLNKIYLNHGIFGVKDAAKYYFGKDDLSKLTIGEMATLAAIPKAPAYYSPFAHPDRAKERRDTILRLMAEQGYITAEEKEKAQAEPLPKEPHESAQQGMKKGYQAYVDYVMQEAKNLYDVSEDVLYRGGWKIYTSLDPKMQDAMADAYGNDKLFPKDGQTQKVLSSMIVIDPNTGGIAGMMGGRDYVAKGFNLATDMRRQPGSTFKPLAVYAPALDLGEYNMYSRLSNQKQSFNGYSPRNWNNKYSDTVDMYTAVNQSLNIPAVWLLDKIGITEGMKYIKKFGIELDPQDRNLAIALGGLTKGVSPLKMAQAYTTFVNKGTMVEAHTITKIVDDRGTTVATVEPKRTDVISPQAAWEMHSMLEGVVSDGIGGRARLSGGRPVAGKTGTTQSEVFANSTKYNKDAWFVGYTPQYVAAVWMGFDREDKQNVMADGSGKTADLFKAVFDQGLKGTSAGQFTPPEGTVKHEEPKVEMTAPKLAAVLAMENQKPKVVINWIGNEGLDLTYDLYRFKNDPDAKELIASGIKDNTYVDPLNGTVLYKYIVIPRDADGNEGPPSNIAEVDMSQVEQLLNDGNQFEEGDHSGDGTNNGGQGNNHFPGDQNGDNEQFPPDQGGDNSSGTGRDPGNGGNNGNGGYDGTGGNNGNGNPPPDIPEWGGNQSGGIVLPPPPPDGTQR